MSSGVALAHTHDLIVELGLEDQIALFQVQMPHPLQAMALFREIEPFQDILIIEETAPVIEMQLGRRDRIRERRRGHKMLAPLRTEAYTRYRRPSLG